MPRTCNWTWTWLHDYWLTCMHLDLCTHRGNRFILSGSQFSFLFSYSGDPVIALAISSCAPLLWGLRTPSQSCPLTWPELLATRIPTCYMISSSTTPPPSVDVHLDCIHTVMIKLPPFYTEDPRRWFDQAEAQFGVRNITEDKTQYWYIHTSLEAQTSSRTMCSLCGVAARQRFSQMWKPSIPTSTNRRKNSLGCMS